MWSTPVMLFLCLVPAFADDAEDTGTQPSWNRTAATVEAEPPMLLRSRDDTWAESVMRRWTGPADEETLAGRQLVEPQRVEVAPDVLASIRDGRLQRWSLTLPDGTSILVRQSKRAFHSDGMASVVLDVEGHPGATAILTYEPTSDWFSLVVDLQDLRPIRTYNDRLDQMWWGETREPMDDGCASESVRSPVSAPRRNEIGGTTDAMAAGIEDCATPEISALVLFTDAARIDAGGTGTSEVAIRAAIHDAIELANQSFVNSGIALTIADVGVGPVGDINEEDIDFDEILAGLTDPLDGFLDTYAAPLGVRDLFSADVVILVVGDDASTNAMTSDVPCGQANLMTPDGLADRDFDAAFSVVRRDCLDNYTLAHEVGHNLGARHDRAQEIADMEDVTAGFADASGRTYGFGYYIYGFQETDIMAYPQSPFDDRNNLWSNPDILYGTFSQGGSPPISYFWGVPTGTETNSGFPGTDGADNARLLNLTGDYIASLRGAGSSGNARLGTIVSPSNAGLTLNSTSTTFTVHFDQPEQSGEELRWYFGTEAGSSDLGITSWADRTSSFESVLKTGLPNDVPVWVTVYGRNPTVSYLVAQKRFNRDRVWGSCADFAARVAPEAFMDNVCDPTSSFGPECWTSGSTATCDLKDATPPQFGLPDVHVATRYREACQDDADHEEVLTVWGTTYTGATFCCALADDLADITTFELLGSPRKDVVTLGYGPSATDVHPPHTTLSFHVDILGRNGPDELFGSDYAVTSFPYYSETLDGQAQNDILDGRSGTATLRGGPDQDDLTGGSSTDFLFGDDGDDALDGGAGADMLYGGAGVDILNGNTGADTCWGEAGNDEIYGGADNDVLYGGDNADKLYGDAGNDTLRGGAGVDYLYGNADNDVLLGEGDPDILYGGDGADKLDGGTGFDALYGEAGNDTFCETSDTTGTFASGTGADIAKFLPPSTGSVIGSDSDTNLTCTQAYVTAGGTGCSTVLANNNAFWATVSCEP